MFLTENKDIKERERERERERPAPYLSIIKGYGQRKLLKKYRLSEHSLCVETQAELERERERVCDRVSERECE